MSILSKTSNWAKSNYNKLEDYVNALDNDIRQLFYRFTSLFSVRAISVGSDTDYVSIDSSGNLALMGSATCWEDLRFPVQALKLSGTKPPSWAVMLSGQVLAFSDQSAEANEEKIYFNAQLPHNRKSDTNLHPHIHYISATTSTGDIHWRLFYTWASIGSSFVTPTAITATTINNTTTVNFHQMTTFSPIVGVSLTTGGISSMLICELTRRSSTAADTYTADAHLIEIDFHYEVDSLGSRTESNK